jgi:hypothetical protein
MELGPGKVWLIPSDGATPGDRMDSHFWDIVRDIRSLIQKPDNALFILHTPIGTLTVDRFVYRSETGFVFVQGTDENGRERTAGFSEQQLSTFPFEIRTKPGDKEARIRFQPLRSREGSLNSSQPDLRDGTAV